jgi:type I restriction enzyme S subunit
MNRDLLSGEYKRFPKHWDVILFTKAFKDMTGGQTKIPKGDYLESGDIPIIDQGQDLIGGYTNERQAVCDIRLPCVVFGDHTKIFKFVTKPFALGADGVKVLSEANNIDPKFAYYFLNTLNLPNVGYSRHFRFLKRTFFPLPPLEEQRRIAAILDKADGVRRKRKEAIRLTEELLKSTFLEMFGDSERNFREHYGQDCFLPLEKCIERFIDYRGKTPTKGNSGVPLITAKIIKNGRIQPPNEFIARENYDSWMRRGLPQLGDVLFTTEAPLGEVAQVDDPDIALAQRVLLMRGKSNILDNTYLFGTLQSSFVRDQIERRSTGSTVKGIRQKELRKVVIPIPPIVLQRKYASFAVSQQKCTDRQKLLFKESENLFNSLLQRAFRGEL